MILRKKEKGIVQDQPLSWQVAPWVGSRAGGRQAGSRRVTRNVCVVWHRRPPHRGETRSADTAIMTALSPFSRPVALLCIHLPPTFPLTSLALSNRWDTRGPPCLQEDTTRPPSQSPLCWIYILIRKPVGGLRGPLRVVMSLFWTQGVLPGTVRWYLRQGSADLDQGLTGGER